ncbi:MAG: peptidoglycan-binding protein [Methylobacterium mesophilicum]|nr:peptidoglycan-binding protein [Methylobacterium mesophilicum]
MPKPRTTQRSANRPERKKQPVAAKRKAQKPSAVAAFAARHPFELVGSAGFLLALSFVSANALWYQPFKHTGAFFATRPDASGLSAPAEPAVAVSDPTVRRVQEKLKALGIHRGAVDGLPGADTRKAVAVFQAEAGLEPTGIIDKALLSALDAASGSTGSVLKPARARIDPGDLPALPATTPAADGQRVLLIQKGLRAFGNEAIETDGKMGTRTRAGIKQFQAMFGLAQTGEPEAAVLDKMREVGLVE